MTTQIRGQLCASLQKCANRSHWKSLSFTINHYGHSLHFSIQATESPSVKSEIEQKSPVSLSVQEQQEQEKTIQLTSPENRPSKDVIPIESLKQVASSEVKKEVSNWPVQTSVPKDQVQKSKKQSLVESETATVMESKKLAKEIQQQKETPNATRKQQKDKRDVATQTNLTVETTLQKLNVSTTILFGPYPLSRDEKQSVKCVQVGGNIQQLN